MCAKMQYMNLKYGGLHEEKNRLYKKAPFFDI